MTYPLISQILNTEKLHKALYHPLEIADSLHNLIIQISKLKKKFQTFVNPSYFIILYEIPSIHPQNILESFNCIILYFKALFDKNQKFLITHLINQRGNIQSGSSSAKNWAKWSHLSLHDIQFLAKFLFWIVYAQCVVANQSVYIIRIALKTPQFESEKNVLLCVTLYIQGITKLVLTHRLSKNLSLLLELDETWGYF